MLKTLSFLVLLSLSRLTFASPAEEPQSPPFGVNLSLQNFSPDQEDKVLKAARLIKKIIVNDEFKRAVIEHTWRGKRTFVDNNGLTNEEIYQKMLEASEDLRPGADRKMDLDLEVYFEDTRTVGYTRPTVFKIWMNSKYLDKNGPAEVTTNMMHEWLHKLGFKHELHHSERRMHTVPYAIGYLMERFAKKVYSDGSF